VYVDAVLGLSVTPTSFGLVLVEGSDADGATMDRDAFDVEHGAVHTSEQATAAVLRTEAIAATRGVRLHSIGLTWSEDAGDQASQLIRSLSESGFDIVPIRLPEATEALARGMADVIGFETTAVCVIEPETVITLIVHTGDGAVQTAFNHAIDTEESLISWLSAVFTKADWQPQALVVVGSAGGFDEFLPLLEEALSVPVFSPAEAELALARGAALASTSASDLPFAAFVDSPVPTARAPRTKVGRRPLAQVSALTMLVAGVLTFVVSVSVAISLELGPHEQSGPVAPAGTVEAPQAPAAPAVRQSERRAAPVIPAPPAAPVAPPPLPEAPPVDVQAPAADVPAEGPYPEAPPAPEAPPGALPPDPATLPGPAAPPAAVAPPPYTVPLPTKKPSIRSRIMDRIRGINDPDPAELAPPIEPAPPILPGDVPPVPPVQ
jgi:hypothetical protein